MKHKVGDKVRIKPKEWFERKGCPEDLAEYSGKSATVVHVNDFHGYYELDIDDRRYRWSEYMFEKETDKSSDTILRVTKGFFEEGGPVIIEENYMEKKFKCKDEVLFRCIREKNAVWTYGIVSHETENFVILSGNIGLSKDYYDVLPFSGNEHLLGTFHSIECEEIVLEKGTLVFGECTMDNFKAKDLCLGEFETITKVGTIGISGKYFRYCVPYSKYNPHDIENSLKEVLTVRNGKLVKANVK